MPRCRELRRGRVAEVTHRFCLPPLTTSPCGACQERFAEVPLRRLLTTIFAFATRRLAISLQSSGVSPRETHADTSPVWTSTPNIAVYHGSYDCGHLRQLRASHHRHHTRFIKPRCHSWLFVSSYRTPLTASFPFVSRVPQMPASACTSLPIPRFSSSTVSSDELARALQDADWKYLSRHRSCC
jgi:hypothetical protein